MKDYELKKEKLKNLFYTTLSANQIKKELGISSSDYNKLLRDVKKELGLPSNYKRLPKNLKLYGEDKYYLAKGCSDDFEILEYAPTEEMIIQKLNNYEDTNSNNNYFVGRATKEHMLQVIERDYFDKQMKWDDIMLKYNLPYHYFYELLNIVKDKRKFKGRTTNRLRYIFPKSRNVWLIKKTVDGVVRDYGAFRSLEQTIRLRDYLESIDWDLDLWNNNKEVIEDNIL